jgi:xanthine/CO dehydrogenase XdhC/CoxF family maturation factor
MKEVAEILEAWDALAREGRRAVLATIVQVSGSTYRRAGARMLIDAAGKPSGLLSGGCLEGDLAERARDVLADGRPHTVLYDMTTEEDLVWGLGLGCAGKVRVLLEPLPEPEGHGHLHLLRAAVEQRRPGALATVFGGTHLGRHLGLHPDGDLHGSLGHPAADRAAAADLRSLVASIVERHESPAPRNTRYASADGELEVLVEPLMPPLPLVLFGAGPDAVPVVRLARHLGWHVTVVDHRPAFASADRFPEADAVVLAHPAEITSRLDLGPHTAAVVMTHKYLHDIELLRHLLPLTLRYLGLLGPKTRSRRLLDELEQQGTRPCDELHPRIHGPVGLDVGAETPEEIALSMLAEIQAVRTRRRGGFLSEREGPLHDPAPEPER